MMRGERRTANNWRLFTFEGSDAVLLDYMDYPCEQRR
jgi:hypothetical protein